MWRAIFLFLSSFSPLFSDADFAFSISRELMQSNPDNLFFSPYSAKTALEMAKCGAEGQTLREMGDVLGLQFQSQFQDGFTSIQAIALDRSYAPLQMFQDTLKSRFSAELL